MGGRKPPSGGGVASMLGGREMTGSRYANIMLPKAARSVWTHLERLRLE